MKRLNSLLSEVKGEKAHKKAVEMGLKYKGFGYWVNPTTGQVEYKTENDELVPVEPDVESEKAGKDIDPAGMAAPGAPGVAGAAAPGAMGLAKIQQAAQAAGEQLGDAPEPGQETPDAEDLGWEAGPEGDTCVGDQEKPEPPLDSFVSKQNNSRWTAGPDGSNFTTTSYEEVTEEMDGPGTQVKRLMGMRSQGGETAQAAKSAYDKMGDSGQGAVLRDVLAAGQGAERLGSAVQGRRMRDVIKQVPSMQRDKEKTAEMNKGIQPLLKDPEYDMQQFDEEEDYLDEGAFGQTFIDRQGNVVKRGALGGGELQALSAMRDNPSFPTLINAKFDAPFMHQSSMYNNPGGSDPRFPGEDNYWDPDVDDTDFDKRFPSALGTYAMTPAKGTPLYDAYEGMSPEMQDKAMRNFWKARGQLHRAGFSHNDMHGGNIFVDPETGEVNIIDLGLARQDKVSALMEALGAMDYENQEDYQLAHQVAGANLPERLRDLFDFNREEVEQTIMDSVEDDPDSLDFDEKMQELAEMMRGGIRLGDEKLGKFREKFPKLNEEDFVDDILKMLYNEVGQSEQMDRMSDAYDKRKADTDLIKNANFLRAVKGKPEIDLKNRNVIPPRNLLPDD